MNLVKPNFVCGPHNVSPEHPLDWKLPPVSAIAEDTSLGGYSLKDVMWRKNSYILIWDTMSLEDFHAMEDLINYHNDNGVPIQFVYEKFRQSDAIVLVNIPPLLRERRGGSGKDNYLQNVEIAITEINPR